MTPITGSACETQDKENVASQVSPSLHFPMGAWKLQLMPSLERPHNTREPIRPAILTLTRIESCPRTLFESLFLNALGICFVYRIRKTQGSHLHGTKETSPVQQSWSSIS